MAEYISFQPSDFFSTKLYTGTGSSNAVTGVGFQPDFTWIKRRDSTGSHYLVDAVRGVTKVVFSNADNEEAVVASFHRAIAISNCRHKLFPDDNAEISGEITHQRADNTRWQWTYIAGINHGTDGDVTGTLYRRSVLGTVGTEIRYQ